MSHYGYIYKDYTCCFVFISLKSITIFKDNLPLSQSQIYMCMLTLMTSVTCNSAIKLKLNLILIQKQCYSYNVTLSATIYGHIFYTFYTRSHYTQFSPIPNQSNKLEPQVPSFESGYLNKLCYNSHLCKSLCILILYTFT